MNEPLTDAQLPDACRELHASEMTDAELNEIARINRIPGARTPWATSAVDRLLTEVRRLREWQRTVKEINILNDQLRAPAMAELVAARKVVEKARPHREWGRGVDYAETDALDKAIADFDATVGGKGA